MGSGSRAAPSSQRMPMRRSPPFTTACRVIVQSDDWPLWLGEQPGSAPELKGLLRPYPERLDIWPVDKRIGNVKNESADLIEPLSDRNAALARLGVQLFPPLTSRRAMSAGGRSGG